MIVMASSTGSGSRHKHCLSTKIKHLGLDQISPIHLLHYHYIYEIKLAIKNYKHHSSKYPKVIKFFKATDFLKFNLDILQ